MEEITWETYTKMGLKLAQETDHWQATENTANTFRFHTT
jgi:hypothetical protein